MTFPTPLQITDEEEEEFDWEAAVREIDVACENTKRTIDETSIDSSYIHGERKMRNFRKQSTLDEFIGKGFDPGSPPERGNREKGDGIDVREERTSCVEIDAEAAKSWIYPVNVPLRDYQLAITKTALFSNTLVALPTGLGKTLIAAVVMYNYFRWFPDGKIVFTAPSRPLVMQQIEACHNIVGIPQEWTIDMTGQINPTTRACLWKTKRVFFVTPQVLEKDIQAGTCLVRYLVCLVIDEAHRALGNYSYCVAVRKLMTVPVDLRILALTATPGSKQQAIQHIIDNLHISILEYRNESDPDVSQYIHDRKIELIEVELGKDAVDINKRLLEVIRPYVVRLSAMGLLPSRDYSTLSPPDLLNSRDEFRRAPPADLPQNRYGEIEAYFGALITLYHVRKLLSSHGIRPAYEMLEEKLKQGSFARVMSKNENIRKVKLIMEQSLSHGAPSPKLTKMLEVLVAHFKTKDPQNSRVIIFSNFRGSVRDIMNSLASIGDLVKATEFIGQSSGKTLKGQSQKVQQAVLQKFRAGGYNVIVATSIGEEGLDIMEVDLVICFDANVSPLRMIQRMGRTGRKHDGRVVVLACEGSELKGYMRKQANGRAIRKHMHNGGRNSFNFHSSPRMIPHIYKPEVQFVKMSIEQYIPRGKNVKSNDVIQKPNFKDKLTVVETAVITKHFQPSSENTWRPSIIAFPRFQAFPSRVHKVMHSCRTDILIDTMQHLQGLSFCSDNRVIFTEKEVASNKCLEVDTVESAENNGEDLLICDDSPSIKSQKEVTDYEVRPVKTLGMKKKHTLLCPPSDNSQNPPAYSYFFDSDFKPVDINGSPPIPPLDGFSHPMCTSPRNTVTWNHLTPNSCDMKTTGEDVKELTVKGKVIPDQKTSETQCDVTVTLPVSRLSNSEAQQEVILDCNETVPESPIIKRNLSRDCAGEAHEFSAIMAPSLHGDEHSYHFRDNELSPRLTNMLQSGIVPESPVTDMDDSGLLNVKRKAFLIQELVSPAKVCAELLQKKSPNPKKTGNVMDGSFYHKNASVSPVNREIQTTNKVHNIAKSVECGVISPAAEESNTPDTHVSRNSNSKDWLLSSGDNSQNVHQVCKFKRLRKVGDMGKNENSKGTKENRLPPMVNLDRSFSGASPNHIKQRKGKKQLGNVRAFIEEEAEVSSEGAEISDSEEDCLDNSSYDQSFIDDKINPTAASTQGEDSRLDMMAIYRRSLLSQSPMERESSSATLTPNCGASISRMNENSSSATPQTVSANQNNGRDCFDSIHMKSNRNSATMLYECSDFLRENENKLETRKRKLSFGQSGSIYDVNLMQSGTAEKQSLHQGTLDGFDGNKDIFHDDQFFASLDLDAVEAQATMLLKDRSELSVNKHDVVQNLNQQGFELHNSPSFDLGI